ncbi:MAG TPA: 6,7-dimethyl-8-ribityllumazine synthase [Alphaproteobacteria bacterium]|nr:6,7-dimethyl-8-ribityllumazine synthase [Alphaproteobacteria bacterium]
MTAALPKPHIMSVESCFYPEIASEMAKGAMKALDDAGVTYERFEVPGCLEIPSAILYGITMKEYHPARRRFDGYVALGCVIKGETYHFEIVADESARGLQNIATTYAVAIGNGIITAYDKNQALARANSSGKNKGGDAARACLSMIGIKARLGLYPRD